MRVLSGVALMEIAECLGDGVRVITGMLNVVTHGFAVDAQIDHDVVVEDSIIDRFPRPQFDTAV
jgi:hypothetical protein